VLTAFLHASISLGDLAHELVEARADGVLDAAEFAQLQVAANRHMAAIQSGMFVLASQVRDVPAVVPVGVHALKGRAA